jgi:hypothetical protein
MMCVFCYQSKVHGLVNVNYNLRKKTTLSLESRLVSSIIFNGGLSTHSILHPKHDVDKKRGKMVKQYE